MYLALTAAVAASLACSALAGLQRIGSETGAGTPAAPVTEEAQPDFYDLEGNPVTAEPQPSGRT